MKHLLRILLAFVIFTACSETKDRVKNPAEIEADSIANNIHDADSLYAFISKYGKARELSAELIVRQAYGQDLRNRSNFAAAVAQHDTCINLATKLKDTLQLIIALNNQGTNYRRLGDIEKASSLHYMALDLCDKTSHDTSFVARKNRVRTLNGLGNVLLSLGNLETAEECFTKALKGEESLGSLTGQAINYANLGAIREQKGELDTAREYYKSSLEKNDSAHNNVGISLCYKNLGHIEELLHHNDKAHSYYLLSCNIAQQTGDTWHWLNPCINMVSLFISKHKTDSARIYLNQAIDAAHKIHSVSHLADVYKLSADLYEMEGNSKAALNDIRIYQFWHDSIMSEKNFNHLQNLRINYEAKKREDLLSKAENKAKTERRVLWTIICCFLAIVVLICIASLSQRKIAKERNRSNMILQRIDHERKEFYRGITHQLRTPLTIVSGLTEQLLQYLPQDNEKAMKEFETIRSKNGELIELMNKMFNFNKDGSAKIEVSELYSSSDHNQHDRTTNEEESKIPTEGEYILIAEDDPDIAMLITDLLQQNGYQTVWRQNGLTTLDTIRIKPPQLLLTDIMMPEMDGLQLIEHIRSEESLRHIPIIVVSARSDDQDRLAGIKAGAEVYISKPFVPEELMLCVRKTLEQRNILRNKYKEQIRRADEMVQEETIENVRNEKARKFLIEVDEIINANIMNSDLSASLLASKMCITTQTLNRKIKTITGKDTTRYIRISRLARSKHLLMNTEMSIGEIQAVCGFESPSYYTRAFKAEYGITPTEFKRK